MWPERFWAKVEMGDGDDACWPWTGARNGGGYGHVRLPSRDGVRGRLRYVHRVAYELLVGPIPEGLEIDHLCRNRACVNPAHLEPVTSQENVRRGLEARGYLAACQRGHELAGRNLYVQPNGRRICRTCKNADNRRRRAWL